MKPNPKPISKWLSYIPAMAVIVAFSGICLAFLYGGGQCQQPNPPSFVRPILSYVCPATPTFLPVPSTTPDLCLQPGDDWKCNCISSTNWQPYSEPSESLVRNDCWDLDKWGIAAEQGNLLIVAENNRGSTIQDQYTRRGILTPLSPSTTISLDVVITILSTNYVDQLSNLTIAIIPSNPIDPMSGVSLIYQRESTDYPIFMKLNERGTSQDYLPLSYSPNQKHHLMIETSAVSVSIYVDGSLVVGPEPLPLNPALWIGYLLPRSGEINATISSLNMVTK